ncbi:MAG: hypothetical protein H0W73_09695 [Bacteroidetes bacterium]|nr:hypothetical protein [Bacteroidota bacterium]
MEKEKSDSQSSNKHILDPNTISKDTADRYVDDWQSGNYSLVPSSGQPDPEIVLQLDSFLFSIDDFKDYVARVDAYNSTHDDQPITGTICKIGIKDNPIPNCLPAKVPALFFEPVTGFKKDPLSPGQCLGDLQPLTSVAPATTIFTSARYDFSYPCPPTCAVNK